MPKFIPLLVFCLVTATVFAQSSPPAVPSQAGSTEQASKPTSEEIVAHEQELMDLLVAADSERLQKLLMPDFSAITDDIRDRDAYIEAIKAVRQTCPLDQVHINDPYVNILSPDVATIAYSVTIKTNCNNRAVTATSNNATVWVRKDGQWRVHLHTQAIVNGFAVQSH